MLVFLLRESEVAGLGQVAAAKSSAQPNALSRAWKMHVTAPQHDANRAERLADQDGVRTGTASISALGRTRYENAIKPCRDLGCRHPVNCAIVRPERQSGFANRAELPSAQRHGHGAGAKGEAAAAAGANGEHWYSSPERAGRPDDGSNGGRVAAGFCRGEAGPSRERGQQLQRWLRVEPPTWQGPLGWMQ
jgi:hypothetical protein